MSSATHAFSSDFDPEAFDIEWFDEAPRPPEDWQEKAEQAEVWTANVPQSEIWTPNTDE